MRMCSDDALRCSTMRNLTCITSPVDCAQLVSELHHTLLCFASHCSTICNSRCITLFTTRNLRCITPFGVVISDWAR